MAVDVLLCSSVLPASPLRWSWISAEVVQVLTLLNQLRCRPLAGCWKRWLLKHILQYYRSLWHMVIVTLIHMLNYKVLFCLSGIESASPGKVPPFSVPLLINANLVLETSNSSSAYTGIYIPISCISVLFIHWLISLLWVWVTENQVFAFRNKTFIQFFCCLWAFFFNCYFLFSEVEHQ